MKQVKQTILTSEGRLDIQRLRQLTARPMLFEPGEPLFWNDPHISMQMLEAHLNPNIDAASRKPETIDRTVDSLYANLGLREGQQVIDLGCGPGLYCTRFCQRGLRVTGVDYSERSIEYARAQARDQGLPVEYVYQDYLTIDYENEYDAAFIIYCDFGVLSGADRDNLLRRVWRALKPGGLFAFDVWTDEGLGQTESQSWEFKNGGFWSPEPYSCLFQRYYYPDDHVRLDQYLVMAEDLSARVYRVWERAYSPESITQVLEAAGFAVKQIRGDLTGSPLEPGNEMMGVVCQAQK